MKRVELVDVIGQVWAAGLTPDDGPCWVNRTCDEARVLNASGIVLTIRVWASLPHLYLREREVRP